MRHSPITAILAAAAIGVACGSPSAPATPGESSGSNGPESASMTTGPRDAAASDGEAGVVAPDTVPPVTALIDTMVAPGLMDAEVAPAPMAIVSVVTQNGAEQHVVGLGNAAGMESPESVLMRIGSVTKPLTALAAATLVVDGTTSADDLVLPGVTLSELVRHTSGLPVLPDHVDSEAPQAYTVANLDAFLTSWSPPDAATGFVYSTVGYAALGRVIADLGGEPFAAHLDAQVLQPLGMTQTTFEPGVADLHAGHDDAGETIEDPARSPALWPSGSIASSARDLTLLVSAYLDPGGLDDLLVAALDHTLDTTDGVEAFPGSVTARGWFYFADLDTYWHSGSAPGSSAFVAFSPSCGAGLVLLVDIAIPQGDPRLAMAAFQFLAALRATGHCVAN